MRSLVLTVVFCVFITIKAREQRLRFCFFGKGRLRVKGLDILIVEDERSQREMLRDFLRKEGHRVDEAENGVGAIQLIQTNHYNLVLLDYKMPGSSGLDVLRQAKQLNPELDVVIVTAYGTIEIAVGAMKAGALDYITKPIQLEELLILIDRAAQRQILLRENEILRQELMEKEVNQEQIIYKSPKMAELINLAGRISQSKASVLIQGESGTGKELLARLIHTLSQRSKMAMVTVNCAAIPESLVESELFGHEKGAFTGALHRRIGRFEQADGGTLFLDEIGEISPSVQVKLLRFLQDGEYQRVGGAINLQADVRVISATNQNLEAELREGSFRDDLFYRLNVITITIPPLRERREDIPPLIDHFIGRFAGENRKKIEGVSQEARDLLIKYDYPGNVRELENIVERAVVISRGTLISRDDLPFRKEFGENFVNPEEKDGGLQESVETLERRLIRKALDEEGSNQTKAAAILGISERMLRYKLKKYGFK
jgi:two-component system NtrC family response regulator